MFLGNTLSSAASGLDSIERQIALLSQNVANANTPNYVRQTLPLSSLETAGGPAGVRTGLATRSIDDHLQAQVFTSVGTEAGSTTTQAALAGIDQIAGTPGSGQDLASLLGGLRDSFSNLANDPASSTQQLDVLDKAGSVVNGLHTIGTGLVQARQAAQDSIVKDVVTVNDALHAVGTLSDQIIATKASGQSTADLEDQRDGQLRSLAQLTGARGIKQSNGDVLVIAGNSVLPTRATNDPFTIANANINGGSGSGPTLLLNGVATSGLGGQVGANLTLRDTTVPALQSKLDNFAASLASSFSGQGVALFTDASGSVPSGTTTTNATTGVQTTTYTTNGSPTPPGLSLTIQVSAAAQTSPSFVRDGSATPTTGAAGDSTLINNVLSNVFSSSSSGLPAQASSLVASYAQQASQAQTKLTTDTAVRSGLETRLSSVTGVSVDSELAKMVQLQAAYGANAKVITAVQEMWTQLLQVVQ